MIKDEFSDAVLEQAERVRNLLSCKDRTPEEIAKEEKSWAETVGKPLLEHLCDLELSLLEDIAKDLKDSGGIGIIPPHGPAKFLTPR